MFMLMRRPETRAGAGATPDPARKSSPAPPVRRPERVPVVSGGDRSPVPGWQGAGTVQRQPADPAKSQVGAGPAAAAAPASTAGRDDAAPERNRPLEEIDAQIMLVVQQLKMPINPLRGSLEERLQVLQAQRSRLAEGGSLRDPTAELIARTELIAEAARLGEKQGKRSKAYDFIGRYESTPFGQVLLESDDFRRKMADLDIYWDKKAKDYRRDPQIDAGEREVLFDPAAQEIYNAALSRVLNEPPEKSWFDRAIGFICRNTEPCAGNMEFIHGAEANGMTPEDARFFALMRMGTMAIPSEGPGDLIELGPGPGLGELGLGPPALEAAGGEPVELTPEGVPAPRRPPTPSAKPMEATGPKEPDAPGRGKIQGGRGKDASPTSGKTPRDARTPDRPPSPPAKPSPKMKLGSESKLTPGQVAKAIKSLREGRNVRVKTLQQMSQIQAELGQLGVLPESTSRMIPQRPAGSGDLDGSHLDGRGTFRVEGPHGERSGNPAHSEQTHINIQTLDGDKLDIVVGDVLKL
jgi:hypothetical protein